MAYQRTVWINFKGSVSNLMASTKAANDQIMKLGTGVLNVGKGLLSALGGNFQPILKTAVGAITSFAKVLFLIPSFLIALVNPMNVINMAMTKFSDAISASSPEEFLAATRNMAPAMVSAVMSVRLLEPELKNLYGIIEQGFWAGFSTDVTQLSQVYFPVLDSGLGSIGTTLGSLREQLVQFLLQPAVVATIQGWMTSFGDWFKTMLPLVENLFPVMISLFQSFGAILVSLLPIFTTVVGWFVKILSFITPIISGITGVASAATGAIGGGTSGASGGTSSSGGGIGGFFGGIISGIGNFFSGLFGRAGGGSVMGGHSYIVGERGPEILSMAGASSGNITPTGKGHTFVNVKIGDQDLRDIISHQILSYAEGVAVASRMGRGLMV